MFNVKNFKSNESYAGKKSFRVTFEISLWMEKVHNCRYLVCSLFFFLDSFLPFLFKNFSSMVYIP